MKKFKEFLPAMEACQEMTSETGKLHTVRQLYSNRSYMVMQGMGAKERSGHVYTARPSKNARPSNNYPDELRPCVDCGKPTSAEEFLCFSCEWFGVGMEDN